MSTPEIARFEGVVLPFLDDAYGLARYLLRDEHDAQDVVQDAVLRALRHFGGFREGDARAWLLAITRNCCLTFLRNRKDPAVSLSNSDGTEPPELIDGAATDERAIRSSDRAIIERGLAALPFEFREVIVMREINDLSYKEISEVTGVPIGTVMSRLARARRKLASALGILVAEAS
jgi:RNA polymerase sigma-70 factor (ECF subfamily)